jgi:ubiquinone/menaquinone biosynthesis C-methylase UbiE
MTEHAIVYQSKERFDRELHTPRYRRIHADDDHQRNLLSMMDVEPQQHYLDIGTGNGYMAFALAQRFSNISVTGIDIAENSIVKNQQIARENALKHVDFQIYNGMELPFADTCCHGVVSRYAFHHFPKPDLSAREIARVLQPGGYFVLADPVAYDGDTEGFIDKFQQMLPDGHVCFYKAAERERIFEEAGFSMDTCFFSSVRYPRKLHDGYHALFEQTSQPVLDLYNLDFQQNEVWITVKVANTKFRKGNNI